MQTTEIQKYAEHLFQIALAKCQNFSDAEDLTQETLLAALQYQKPIYDMKAWLGTVLNRKYYDMLRKKYKLPVVSMDIVPEAADMWETAAMPDKAACDDRNRPDAETVRREVAYLGEKYRTVIVRHHLYGEKVQDIANDLGIPKGTVLSRLSGGREQMRKGLDDMREYEKQSYSPERLDISCHGSTGFRDEPWSLVADDLMKQNILIVAYEKPLTMVEIAKAIGIPTAYIETAVKQLTKSELMRKIGNGYATDFMIVTTDDLDRSLDVQIEFAEANYKALLTHINEYLEQIRASACYGELSRAKQKKLEYFFVLHLFSTAVYTAVQRIVPAKEEYPQRPDGGSWIAEGTKYPRDFDFENNRFGKYCYAGMRGTHWENFLCAQSVDLKVYDTQPDLNKYEHGPVEINDDNLAKLLYILSRDLPIEETGFDPVFLKDIPHLTECGVLGKENGKVVVEIPLLSPDEYHVLDQLRAEYMVKLADFLEPGLKELFPKLKIEIPKHLKGRVAEFRQYLCYAIPMAFMKKAIAEGDFDASGAVPPMVLVVDK